MVKHVIIWTLKEEYSAEEKAKIKADIDALLQNKFDIEKRIIELQSLNSNLDNLLSDIEASWTGAASKQYITTMRQHKIKTEQMVVVLNEFKGYINQAATEFEQQDKEGASKIRGC